METAVDFATGPESREEEARDENELTRALAWAADAASGLPIDLATVWTGLGEGRYRVADTFLRGERYFLLLSASVQRPKFGGSLTGRKLAVLERVLLLGGQKAVAVELKLAPSTVAILAGGCLRAMGVASGASRIPLLLALSAHASHVQSELSEARSSVLEDSGHTYLVVSAARPEGCLKRRLSPAEFAVIRLLLEGKSHAEMSAERRTAMRTIANQLAAAFNKLGVSGRSDLIREMVHISTLTPGRRSPSPLSIASPRTGEETPLRAVSHI